MALFIGTLAIAWAVMPTQRRTRASLGLDFIAFYTAGTFVREGRAAEMYDLNSVRQFEKGLADRNGIALGDSVGPWWNPPFYAWVFAPLSKLEYPTAVRVWIALNLVCAAIAVALLCRMLIENKDDGRANVIGWRTWALIPILLIISIPFIHAITHGQNTCTSLLLVTGTAALWRNERAFAAGLVAGLLFYKPQLGAVLAVVLVMDLGWAALAGLVLTGSLLLIATLLLPGTLQAFLHQLPANLHVMQELRPYVWERHVTFKAFWRVLLQGTGTGATLGIVNGLAYACMAIVGTYLLRTVWTNIGSIRANSLTSWHGRPARDLRSARARHDGIIAATIAATPLLMPFYFDYDQVLLLVPAALLARELMHRPYESWSTGERWIARLWPIHYVWLMLNPEIAAMTRVNLVVPLWAAVALLLIRRVHSEVTQPSPLFAEERIARMAGPGARPLTLALSPEYRGEGSAQGEFGLSC